MTRDEKAGMKALKKALPKQSGRQWKQLRKALQREDAVMRRDLAAKEAA